MSCTTCIYLLIKAALCTLLFFYMVELAVTQAPVLKDLSLHVIDIAFGGDAPNVTCKLYRKVETNNPNKETFDLIVTAVTDGNGRIAQFLPVNDYTFGTYRVWFGIGDYYLFSHGVTTFFPEVQVTYDNKDGSASHVPLTITPYGITNNINIK